MNIVIRDIKKEEIEKIAKLNINALNKSFSKFLLKSTIKKFNLEERKYFFMQKFISNKSKIKIAYNLKTNDVIGFIVLDFSYNIVEIVSFYIDYEGYKKKIYENLFLEVKKFCIKNKIKQIVIWIFKNNLDSINFYKSLGFYITNFERQSRIEYGQIELQFVKKI